MTGILVIEGLLAEVRHACRMGDAAALVDVHCFGGLMVAATWTVGPSRPSASTPRTNLRLPGRHLGWLQVFAWESFAVHGGARRVKDDLVVLPKALEETQG